MMAMTTPSGSSAGRSSIRATISVAALDAGLRSADELLDRVWSDASAVLRPAAIVTLAAHLDKLDEEGRLPEGVERPQLPVLGQS